MVIATSIETLTAVEILRNTFLSARQIYQQLQQQISHTTQSTDTAFTQDLPSDMASCSKRHP